MPRYFIQFSYDGTAYHGWQVQPNGITVQQVLTEAMQTLLRQEVALTGAGRTDAGVNARCMIAHFDLEDEIDGEWLTDKLNRLLPQDICVSGVRQVHPDAHARFDAKWRKYEYLVTTSKNCFMHRYAMRLYRIPDFELMNCVAEDYLLGKKDFTSFSKLHTDVKTNICEVMEAHWDPVEGEPGMWRFTIRADRFLRNMVRAVVGTLLEVGLGKMTPEAFGQVLDSKDRCAAGTSVDAKGLFLVEVAYPY